MACATCNSQLSSPNAPCVCLPLRDRNQQPADCRYGNDGTYPARFRPDGIDATQNIRYGVASYADLIRESLLGTQRGLKVDNCLSSLSTARSNAETLINENHRRPAYDGVIKATALNHVFTTSAMVFGAIASGASGRVMETMLGGSRLPQQMGLTRSSDRTVKNQLNQSHTDLVGGLARILFTRDHVNSFYAFLLKLEASIDPNGSAGIFLNQREIHHVPVITGQNPTYPALSPGAESVLESLATATTNLARIIRSDQSDDKWSNADTNELMNALQKFSATCGLLYDSFDTRRLGQGRALLNGPRQKSVTGIKVDPILGMLTYLKAARCITAYGQTFAGQGPHTLAHCVTATGLWRRWACRVLHGCSENSTLDELKTAATTLQNQQLDALALNNQARLETAFSASRHIIRTYKPYLNIITDNGTRQLHAKVLTILNPVQHPRRAELEVNHTVNDNEELAFFVAENTQPLVDARTTLIQQNGLFRLQLNNGRRLYDDIYNLLRSWATANTYIEILHYAQCLADIHPLGTMYPSRQASNVDLAGKGESRPLNFIFNSPPTAANELSFHQAFEELIDLADHYTRPAPAQAQHLQNQRKLIYHHCLMLLLGSVRANVRRYLNSFATEGLHAREAPAQPMHATVDGRYDIRRRLHVIENNYQTALANIPTNATVATRSNLEQNARTQRDTDINQITQTYRGRRVFR